jgi:hypothetical protein
MVRKPFVFEDSFLFDCFSKGGVSGYWLQLPDSELHVVKSKVKYFLYIDHHDMRKIRELE